MHCTPNGSMDQMETDNLMLVMPATSKTALGSKFSAAWIAHRRVLMERILEERASYPVRSEFLTPDKLRLRKVNHRTLPLSAMGD